MIDLTPLDVRKKAGDFRRILRGYDPEEVDGFLQLAAERLEELVKENLTLKERTERLHQQVLAHAGRESAVQEALVMAQQLREDLRAQAEREAELARQEIQAQVERATSEAERRLETAGRALSELEERRLRFLRSFRSLLQRELEAVEVEEARAPEEETAIELEFGVKRRREPARDRDEPASIDVDPATASASVHEGDPSPGDAAAPDALWLSSILQETDGRSGRREEKPPA